MVIKKSQEPNKAKETKTKKTAGQWALLVGKVVLIATTILVALGLIFNKQISEFVVKQQSDPSAYMKVSKSQMKKNAQKKGNFDPDSAVPVSAANLAKAKLAGSSQPVIGAVAMPQLGINLPIMLDDGDYSMLYGAGPILPNQVMGEGNYTLASHDMWTNASYYSKDLLFSPLVRAKVGQDIYITDKNKVYHYVATEQAKIKPTEWDRATAEIPGKKVITLLTCDTNDRFRIMVRGELQDVKDFDDKDAAKPFTGNLNQYWK